jgi:hypothetical protein
MPLLPPSTSVWREDLCKRQKLWKPDTGEQGWTEIVTILPKIRILTHPTQQSMLPNLHGDMKIYQSVQNTANLLRHLYKRTKKYRW